MTFPSSATVAPVAGGKSDAVRVIAEHEIRAGNPVEAERVLRQFLASDPLDVPVLVMLADALHASGHLKDALVHLQRASAAAPHDGSIRWSMARLLEEQGFVEEALRQVESIGPPLRADHRLRAFEAALLGRLGDHDREIAIYEAMLGSDPDHAPLWMTYGNALKYAGRSMEAEEAIRKSVAIRPTFGEGWWSLANMKSAKFESADLAIMRKALKTELSAEDALHLHFALGKALEDRGRFEQSFRHYAEGNRIRASRFSPEQLEVTPFVDYAIDTFGRELFARLERKGDRARDPIFVVGLQRSGSTLVEQILASHPMIEGTAELMAMQHLWADVVRSATREGKSAWDWITGMEPDQCAALGADYLERARPYRRTDRAYFVDKMPANWMMVGLIRLILPNATIIDARRHPMACGFSNFKQHYATGVSFSYSQRSIGQFYADYLRLMEHFDQVQPGTVHHLLNERLIEDQEGEVRAMLKFVGVPFDPACLESHRTKRAVNTPSAEQVRRPVNREGMDYWRQYEGWLGPMREALGDSLDKWDQLPS